MSVISLANATATTVTAGEFQRSVEASGFTIKNEDERRDYLLLLHSADAVIQALEDAEDYIPPTLRPVETLEARSYWRPSAKDNPLNAWSHRCDLQAKNPTSSLLQGRAVALKDNISVGGLPTTIGTFPQLLSHNNEFPQSPIDATAVRRLLEAGAVIKGTATCENFSLCPLSYSSASGPVHNPWLKGYNVGGSSSGPGALLAAAMLAKTKSESFGELVDLAIGGDQGGSIRLPAAYAGVYGLKPTHGLVPYTGTAALIPMLDHIGPMATNVQDIAVLLQAIAGSDDIDTRTTAGAPMRGEVKDYPKLIRDFMEGIRDTATAPSLKVGLLKEGFITPGLNDSVRDIVKTAAMDVFAAAGIAVSEVSVPIHSLGPVIWTAATRASMADFAFKGQVPGHLSYAPPHLQPQLMSQEAYDLLTATNPAVVNVAISGQHLKSKFGNHAEAKAHRKIFELRAAYDAAFEEVDIVITPTVPTVAMPLPKLELTDGEGSSVMDKLNLSIGSTANTCGFNVTGHPAISIPCGFAAPADDVSTKLPVGMQLVARRWDEETLLKAAALFEAFQPRKP